MINIYELAKQKMNPEDIDHHESDLYLKQNEVSRKLVEDYDYKNQVTTFISNIEPHVPWYDIPFAYPLELVRQEREEELKRSAEFLKEIHNRHRHA